MLQKHTETSLHFAPVSQRVSWESIERCVQVWNPSELQSPPPTPCSCFAICIHEWKTSEAFPKDSSMAPGYTTRLSYSSFAVNILYCPNTWQCGTVLFLCCLCLWNVLIWVMWAPSKHEESFSSGHGGWSLACPKPWDLPSQPLSGWAQFRCNWQSELPDWRILWFSVQGKDEDEEWNIPSIYESCK